MTIAINACVSVPLPTVSKRLGHANVAHALPKDDVATATDALAPGAERTFAYVCTRPGQYIGSTDEIGMHAQEAPAHVNDIHASMLYALGLDHLKLTYMHNGRAERPTVVAGEVINRLFA